MALESGRWSWIRPRTSFPPLIDAFASIRLSIADLLVYGVCVLWLSSTRCLPLFLSLPLPPTPQFNHPFFWSFGFRFPSRTDCCLACAFSRVYFF